MRLIYFYKKNKKYFNSEVILQHINQKHANIISKKKNKSYLLLLAQQQCTLDGSRTASQLDVQTVDLQRLNCEKQNLENIKFSLNCSNGKNYNEIEIMEAKNIIYPLLGK